MKKIIFALVVCALLCACDGGGEVVNTENTAGSSEAITSSVKAEINIAEFCSQAVSLISFDVKVEEIAAEAMEYLYPDLPEGTVGIVYSTGGAGADELAVFESADPEGVLAAVEAHRQSQREAYASYKPEDTAKIDSAVVYQRDNYTVFCVSADSKAAESVIKGLMG